MTAQKVTVFSEVEYLVRFNQAMGYYRGYIRISPQESLRHELAERAAQTAGLPVLDSDLCKIMVLYHDSPAPYRTSLLRYIYLAYTAQQP